VTCPDRLIALIPAYNEEATVGQIVARVQQLWNCPVIVIDDCSIDATAQVARAAGPSCCR
jgi:glycosyltransferase involved in cell wall biosynthesis